MKKLLLAFLLLFATPAHAGTLLYCTSLGTQTAVGSTNGAVTKFTAQNYKSMTAVLTWANVAGSTPTLDVKLQSCRTSVSTTCKDWPSSTQLFAQHTTSSGVENVDINQMSVNNWPYFRAVSTVGGSSSPTFTYTVELCVDANTK